MTQALSVKHEIKQIDQPPARTADVTDDRKQPKPNPFVNAMMSLALAQALQTLSPETGALVGTLMSVLTLKTVHWVMDLTII